MAPPAPVNGSSPHYSMPPQQPAVQQPAHVPSPPRQVTFDDADDLDVPDFLK
jgi:cell division protein FtsZ